MKNVQVIITRLPKRVNYATTKVLKDITEYFNFSVALRYCKNGIRITRKAWATVEFISFVDENLPPEVLPYFRKKTSNGYKQNGWRPTQTDMLTDDWFISNHPIV